MRDDPLAPGSVAETGKAEIAKRFPGGVPEGLRR
jgi:hypothetical protein